MKTWLEVALNGSWGKALQPGIPVSVAEIIAEGIACAREGAAIVHVHAYDEASGRQCEEAHVYQRIIEGIRSQVDCIVYPTIPLTSNMPAAERFAAVEALARGGLIEWAVVDPGSVNIAGFVYINPEEHARHGLGLAARYGFRPAYAIYEPGFVRLGAALARAAGGAPQPVYRFMFSEGFSYGFPPAEYALDAYLQLLASEAPGAPWMVGGLAVDVLKLAPAAIARGGHVRVGLEDAPLGSLRSNLEWVQAARLVIERTGATLASVAGVRSAIARLWKREMPRRVYEPRLVLVRLRGGRLVRALAFLAGPGHPSYVRELDVHGRARLVAQGIGIRGPCVDYIQTTLAHMHHVGVRDPHLERVLHAALALRENHRA